MQKMVYFMFECAPMVRKWNARESVKKVVLDVWLTARHSGREGEG
jgi:hypothetical protein